MNRTTLALFTQRAALAWYLLALAFCASASPNTQKPAAAAYAPAQLVIGIVIDQLGSSTLERFLPYLADDGLLTRAVRSGTYFERVRFDYATTVTAVGHAAIYTGQPPRYSGIANNRVWNPTLGKWLNIVDDQTHRVFGTKEEFASPAALKAQTVGDRLKSNTKNQARVVSVSIKPWPAVMSGGTKSDMVAWYSDTKPGRMVTSTYYAPQLPDWIEHWNQSHPVDKYLSVWSAGNPKLLQQVLGDDARAGEGHVDGWHAALPHDPRASANPYDAFTFTPQSTEYLLDFAHAARLHYEMGKDDVPDLLMISISGSDKIGHHFGPDSWEYLDNLVKIDKELGHFVSELEAQSRVAVLITSDHGCHPLPERSPSPTEARVSVTELTQRLRSAAVERLGPGDWIAPVQQPLIAFGSSIKTAAQRLTLVDLVKEVLSKDKRIAAVFDLQALKASVKPTAALKALVWRSTSPTVTADMYVIPAPGVVISDRGTTHGSPWPYDRDVPVLIYGKSVANKRHPSIVSQQRVAATFSELLGIPASQNNVHSLLK